MAGEPANPFWAFSLSLYGRDGVAPACLRLQDRDGLDVNIVLYCCWAATQGVTLDTAAIARISERTAVWRQEVIQPLRAARRALRGDIAPVAKSAGERLREDVKRLELEAERLLQDALWRAFPLSASASGRDAVDLARANLQCYAQALKVRGADADFAIVAGAVSGVSPP